MRYFVAAVTTAAAIAGLGAAATACTSASSASAGQLLCNSEEPPEASQLVTLPLNSVKFRKITHDVTSSWTSARWAPDKSRIVAEWDVPDSGQYGPLRGVVALVRPDGHVTSTIRLPGRLLRPSFLPDGHHVIAEWWRSTADDGLWVMKDDGSERHRVTRNPWPSTGPDDAGEASADTAAEVSPDGRTVAFVRKNAGGRGALDIVGIDGKGLRELLSPDDDIGTKLDWSPDGTRIGGTRDASLVVPIYSANVITVRPDGSDLRKVTNLDGGAVNAFFGSYSPNGKWIVYRLEDHNALS